MDEAKVTVRRFDSSEDKEARYQTYTVPAGGWKELKVLDTLRYIQQHLDGSLAFRESCRQYQICGACAMMVNKKLVLACEMMAAPEMVIEPAPRYEVIKDLVVTFTHSEKEGD